MTHSKKGVLDIEFMLSVFIFLTVLSFVSLTLINSIPKLHQETLSQDIKAKAFQLSEMILFDEGWPANWGGGIDTVKRIGLSSSRKYYLNSTKIGTLQSYCTDMQANYNKIKSKFGLDYTNDFSIEMTDYTTSINCRPPVMSKTRAKAVVTRIGVDDSTKKIWVITVSVL